MTSQVVFNIDSALKAKAMKKARKAGLPFSSILNFAVRAYAEDRLDFGLEERFNAKTLREIRKAVADIKKGKNLSPVFTTVAEGRAWLDN